MDPVVTLLLVLIGVVAVISAILALRNRLAFRLAMRNVRRGRWRTVLLVLGLLVGTTIISGSLVIGDTVNSVNVHFVYQAYGFTSEGVYNYSLTSGNYLSFPYATFSTINASARGDSQIAGMAPEIVGTAQVLDRSNGIPQTGLNLIGANANQTAQLGPFHSTGGLALAGPGPGQAYLDVVAANDLNASVGNPLTLRSVVSVPVVLAAIVQDDTRGGFLGGGSVFVDLSTSQQALLTPGNLNFIAVTNAGPLTQTAALSNSVSATLNTTLASLGHPYGLTVHQLLATQLSQAESSGTSLATLFLVLGLFSIVAGAILIAGIVVMLAEERKGEMGMMRAIGVTRRQLILTFYFEGIAYSAGSALAGTFLGVGLGYLLVYEFSISLSTATVTSLAILQSFTVTNSSLVIAYVAGFLLTLATVAVASRRVGRLNIVRAIRSIPEPAPTVRLYTQLASLGIVLAAVGAILFAFTYQGSSDISYPLIGGAFVIMGLALFASRFLKNRLVFSIAGAALLVWAGSSYLHQHLLGTSHSGTIFVAFVEGILLVLGAVLLYAFNAPGLVAAISRLTSGRPKSVPVVRVGLSYPARRGFRTAINLTIFALVLFTVVAVASFGASLQQNLNQTVQAESGGYTYFGVSTLPIPDLPGMVVNNTTLRPLYSAVVPLNTGGVNVIVPGFPTPYLDGLYAAPVGVPSFENFYTSNQYNFTSTYHGLSASQVWKQVETDPTVAVVDGSYAMGGVNFGGGPAHPTLAEGASITLKNSTGATATVTVIGILNQVFVTGVWVNPVTAAQVGVLLPTGFYLTVAPGVNAAYAGQQLKVAFFSYGLFLYDFAQILQSSIQSTEAIVGLLEVFVALGLAVGIAAMGIVALRAVVERRSEIGMLRAQGFTRGMVFRMFLLEYSFVALLGIGIGAALGILIDYNLASGAGGLLAFTIPWANVALVVAASYLLVVAAVALPSIRAARLPPAEAVRYSE